MGRPFIRVKLKVTSKDDDRFTSPRTFNSIPNASFATSLTDKRIRTAYHLKRELMQKRSGEVYTLKSEEPDPIRVKPPQSGVPPGHPTTVSKKCTKCSKDLTPEDRSSFFFMHPGNDYDRPLHFVPSIEH